jgi:hypothetical protein
MGTNEQAYRAEEPLLAGEDPATTRPEVASRWIAAYTRLVNVKDGLLETAHNLLDLLKEPAAIREIVDTDLPLLEAENDRLHRRLRFWKRRHIDLT